MALKRIQLNFNAARIRIVEEFADFRGFGEWEMEVTGCLEMNDFEINFLDTSVLTGHVPRDETDTFVSWPVVGGTGGGGAGEVRAAGGGGGGGGDPNIF